MKVAEYGSDDNNKHYKGAISTFWKVSYDLASLLTAQLIYLSFRRHCNLSFLS